MKKNQILALVLLTALAGCSGGGGAGSPSTTFITTPGGTANSTSPFVASNPTGTSTAAPSQGGSGSTQTAAVIKIQIPLNGNGVVSQSGTRTPQYVSPNTKGVSIAISDHTTHVAITGSPFVYDVSGGSSCNVISNIRTCSIAIPVTSGTFDFVLDTYDASPVAGAIPGTAKHLANSTITQAIVANQATTIAFLVEGIPSTLSAVNSQGAALTYMSFPADSSTHTLGVIVSAVDGSGSTINGSNPYSAPVAVSLAEAGGSGHTTIIIDGSNTGTSGALVSPSDILNVSYDGKGSSGYGATLSLNGSSTVTLSPMYLSSTSAAITALNKTTTTTISEVSPSAVLYSASATPAACPGVTFSSTSISGPASGATLSITTTAPGGTSLTCPVTISDNYGSSLSFLMNFSTAGPIAPSATVNFTPSGSGSGTCTGGGIQFTSATPTAAFAVTDPGGTGLGATSNNTAIATVALVSGTATITAVASGSTSISFTDAQGNSASCTVSITVANGSISSHGRAPASSI